MYRSFVLDKKKKLLSYNCAKILKKLLHKNLNVQDYLTLACPVENTDWTSTEG